MQETLSRKFCLIGYPLWTSLSPQIHKLFAQQFALKLDYTLQPLESNQLANFVQSFFGSGGYGMNITAPYKEQICQHIHTHDSSASYGAVNTIYKRENILIGANTDQVGFKQSLLQHNINLHGKRILILGAGGAVRGILSEILQHEVVRVSIVNRSIKHAEELMAQFNSSVLFCKPLNEISSITSDLVIHAISSNNLNPDLYAQINCTDTWYDLNYMQQSNFLKVGHAKGAIKLINGLSMLIEQAANAFELWYQLTPNTIDVYNEITAKIGLNSL